MTRAKAPTTKEGSRAKRADREERNARFARLTHDELRGLADDECAEAVAIRLQAAQDAKNVPAAVRHARAAMRLDSDMRSGGFDQFFRSARPEEVPAALEGLVALGAMEAADVLRRAIALARKKHAPASRASNAPAGRPRDPISTPRQGVLRGAPRRDAWPQLRGAPRGARPGAHERLLKTGAQSLPAANRGCLTHRAAWWRSACIAAPRT